MKKLQLSPSLAAYAAEYYYDREAAEGESVRRRCCGRWCFWAVPFGPWCCTTCPRRYRGLPPRRQLARFWEAVDDLVARLELDEKRDPLPGAG